MKLSLTITAIFGAFFSCGTAQFITFDKEGKLGVRFGDYHAAVGLGGAAGSGTSGGLFAEAGTPYGQSAHAGLGGAVGKGAFGKLYAGATAGGDVKASAGLGGKVTAEKAVGEGFAAAQAGPYAASSGLGGVASDHETSGFTYSKANSYSVSKAKKLNLQPVEVAKTKKDVQVSYNVDVANEIKPVQFTPLNTNIETASDVEVKEVQPQYMVTKTYVHGHRKPHRHHLRKSLYFNAAADTNVASDIQPVLVSKTYQPAIDKRVDVKVENEASANLDSAGQAAFTKQITIQRNPTFFADIFNIPISTLQAVSNFLGNGAGAISVQKSASIKADSDKHFGGCERISPKSRSC